jgi:hypothetical protein
MPLKDAALIPRGSPLAIGWRAELAAILLTRKLVDVMDAIAQFAELRVRQEPDKARDPLDEPTVVHREGRGRPKVNADAPLTMNRAADPAHRRIDCKTELEIALEMGREPRPDVLRGHCSKCRTTRSIERRRAGRPRVEV